ncbi:hypothetical protein BIFBRE_05112, partial [Bifidobacterium breve DSM 20213 = JCM 1192]
PTRVYDVANGEWKSTAEGRTADAGYWATKGSARVEVMRMPGED